MAMNETNLVIHQVKLLRSISHVLCVFILPYSKALNVLFTHRCYIAIQKPFEPQIIELWIDFVKKQTHIRWPINCEFFLINTENIRM